MVRIDLRFPMSKRRTKQAFPRYGCDGCAAGPISESSVAFFRSALSYMIVYML